MINNANTTRVTTLQSREMDLWRQVNFEEEGKMPGPNDLKSKWCLVIGKKFSKFNRLLRGQLPSKPRENASFYI